MIVYILATEFADYDAHEFEVKGVVTSKEQADGWQQHDVWTRNTNYSSEVIPVELDQLPLDITKRIDEFLASPFCECGHRKAHHKKGPKITRCNHNHKDTYQVQDVEDGPYRDVPPHMCKEFRLRKG